METATPSGKDKLQELIDEVQIAMLCTKYGNRLHSRPMATSEIDEDGNIWFFTNEFSSKVDEIKNEPEVCLAYSSPSKNTYVSVVGNAELVTDKAKMKELYSPIIKAWFPEGLDDPKLSLLKVTPNQAEYWDSNSNSMVTFFNIVKAAVTGKKYDEGQHEKLDL